MNGYVAQIVSQEVADQVGTCWGLGSGHHERSRPVGGRAAQHVEADRGRRRSWFHGGNLHQSRHYSQFLALQLKARMEGIATPVYGLAEAHHPA